MSTTSHDARQVIASNVRAMLGRKKSSGSALAKALGKSQAAISRRLNGELAFDTDELLGICEHYKVPLTDLLVGIESDENGTPLIHALLQPEQTRLFEFAA